MTAGGGSPGEKPQNGDAGPSPADFPPPAEVPPAYGAHLPPMPPQVPDYPEYPSPSGFPPPPGPPGYGGYPPPGYGGFPPGPPGYNSPPGPPSYGVPYPGSYGYPTAPPRTSKLAIISLVISLLGLICGVGILFALAGIVLGAVAISQMKRTGERGYGQAVAGITIGVVTLAFNLVWLLFAMSAPI